MAASGRLEIPVEAKVTIRVGEHNVELSELADALTRAGLELQKLLEPPKKFYDVSTITEERIVSIDIE